MKKLRYVSIFNFVQFILLTLLSVGGLALSVYFIIGGLAPEDGLSKAFSLVFAIIFTPISLFSFGISLTMLILSNKVRRVVKKAQVQNHRKLMVGYTVMSVIFIVILIVALALLLLNNFNLILLICGVVLILLNIEHFVLYTIGIHSLHIEKNNNAEVLNSEEIKEPENKEPEQPENKEPEQPENKEESEEK